MLMQLCVIINQIMKTIYLTITFLLLQVSVFAQNTVSGKVVDNKNNPIPAANVYIDGSYDGSTTDENGSFTFTTDLKGNQILVISVLTYETSKSPIVVEECKDKTFKMKMSEKCLFLL